MNEILITGERLRLRRASVSDLAYIMALQRAPENLKFIVPFTKDYHREIIESDGSEKLDVIIEEVDTGCAVGYLMLRELNSTCAEYTHLIVGKKGIGYGREALNLLLKWTFVVRQYHRVWIDCKDHNAVALRLYESLGFVREGLLREILSVDANYENLIVLGILDREYFARQD